MADADCAEQTMSPPVVARLVGEHSPGGQAGPARRGEMLAGLVSHEIAHRMYTRRA
jgi:hypothetical protein